MAGGTSRKSSFSRAGIGLGVIVQTVCVIFLVAVANYIGFNYYKRWDFSRSQKFTLADQTEQVLRQLQPTLRVIVYFSPSSLGPETALYADVQNILSQFAFSARRKIEIRYIDPVREVSEAREVQEKYKFDGAQNALILDYEGRVKILPILDMGEFDFSGVQMGEPVQLVEFKGEEALTSALIELLNPKKAKIYFTQGHGETLPAKLSVLLDHMGRQQLEAVGFNLGTVDRLPADADAICLVGPRYDLTEAEVRLLDAYWQGSGRIVILLNPDAVDVPKLRQFLNDNGIYPRNDRVQVVLPSLREPGKFSILRQVSGIFLPGNAITKRLVGANAKFPGATQSIFLYDETGVKKDIGLTPLIQAAEQYWGERDYDDLQKNGLRYDDGRDAGSPLILAAAAERGAAKDERTDIATSRMVVVGNSAFVEDESLRQAPADLDFILSVFNRMIDNRSKLTGITPKSAASFSLSLTDAQIRGVALYTLVVIPAAAALLGLIVGLRRRA